MESTCCGGTSSQRLYTPNAVLWRFAHCLKVYADCQRYKACWSFLLWPVGLLSAPDRDLHNLEANDLPYYLSTRDKGYFIFFPTTEVLMIKYQSWQFQHHAVLSGPEGQESSRLSTILKNKTKDESEYHVAQMLGSPDAAHLIRSPTIITMQIRTQEWIQRQHTIIFTVGHQGPHDTIATTQFSEETNSDPR